MFHFLELNYGVSMLSASVVNILNLNAASIIFLAVFFVIQAISEQNVSIATWYLPEHFHTFCPLSLDDFSDFFYCPLSLDFSHLF